MGKTINKTSIGGQALIEGVMMKSPERIASAIRTPSGEIKTTVRDLPKAKKKSIKNWPIIRGVVNFFEMMKMGYKELMYSAEIAGMNEEETEPSKFEKWLAKTFKKDIMDIVMYIAVILGVGLALCLFVFLPTLIGGLFGADNFWRTVVEAVIKVAIFIGYMAACDEYVWSVD